MTLNEHIWWSKAKVPILLHVISVVIYARPSFTGACEAWIHYAFKFFSPTVFNFDFHKIEMAFCELYTETFERGACEACSLVVHPRTFPSARARSRSKFTKVRSKKLNSFESNSSSHIFMTLKLSRSLWKQLMGECSCARVCSRAVFVNELQIFVVYILSVVFHFCWWPKTPFDLLCHPVIHLQREVASFIAQIIETVNVKCKCPAK